MILDHDTHYTYTRGGCGALAYHLHLLIDKPIVFLSRTKYYEGMVHVALKHSDNLFLDIGGIRTKDEMISDLKLQRYQLNELQVDPEILKKCLDGEYFFGLNIQESTAKRDALRLLKQIKYYET